MRAIADTELLNLIHLSCVAGMTTGVFLEVEMFAVVI